MEDNLSKFWTITDELGDTCQRKDAVIEDGESETWETPISIHT